MIIIRAVKVLLLFSIVFGFIPFSAQSQVLPKFLFEKALQESKDGDFMQAEKDWSSYLQDHPDDAAALSNRGNIRLALGDPQGAIIDQTQAIEISPEDLDPYINRGIAKEALQLWEEARKDYEYVLKKNPKDVSALYNLANVMGSMDNWLEAKKLFSKAASSNNAIAMARSSEALATYQVGDLELAEKKIRLLILKYPLFADARAALSALLWRKGLKGEAESNWAAVAGLDIRYREKDWLMNIRRWPPKPTNDLIAFLALEDK
ncbi:tetratricopeptide repeat protein [Prochlorococcus sp. MIT 0916]|uniref:TPR repeat n=1 Tax=Prochlorococcus marinus str. P0903-H212 TaxID=1622208 RepID=A0A0D5A3X9_PROMR|nr:TPR repeat precursor [Prochlorococcus marinus str. P0903-H212]